MSVTFYGCKGDEQLHLADDDPRHMNLANMNALAFFRFLRLKVSPFYDSIDIPTARRAVIRARALFDKEVVAHTREEVRESNYVCFGIDEDYLRRRLGDFEKMVEAYAELGATHIYWS